MPLLPSGYTPPFPFRNGHFATIYSGLLRKVGGVSFERERLELPDGDFLDLDWSFAPQAGERAVILLHGLEGNARRPYMAGSARELNAHGYDSCAVNFRGCSGETNRLYRSYHSGATEDLDVVIRHLIAKKGYRQLHIKGFSLGGNLCLKYLGEGRALPEELKSAVAVSVPCDLHSSLRQLLHPKNFLYAKRFKKHLLEKLRLKQVVFPERISDSDISRIRTLKDFDDIYTSRAHGFTDALDYYRQCSSLRFLEGIRVPALLINARNDSFLGPECYPERQAGSHDYLFLEMPTYGGHVGFYDAENRYYTEKRTIKFLEETT